MWRGCHSPFGVPSLLTTGPGLVRAAVKAVYQKFVSDGTLFRTAPASEKFIFRAQAEQIFSTNHQIFFEQIGRTICSATSAHRSSDWTTSFNLNPPLINGRPFGNPLSPTPAIESQASEKRHPIEGSSWTVIHMAINSNSSIVLRGW